MLLHGKFKINEELLALKKSLEEVIAKQKEKLDEISPSVSDEVKDTGKNVQEETQNTIQKAEKDLYNNFKFNFGEGLSIYGADDLEISLQNLKSRVENLIGNGQNAGLSDLINIFKGNGTENDRGIIGIVSDVGKYIIYAAILFFGLRCIWSGVEGKTQFKELLPYLLVAVIFLNSAGSLVSLAELMFGSTDYPNYFKDMWSSLVNIVRIVAFAGIIFTGIKLIFSNAEGKSTVKSHLMPILIGCIFVFASSTIVTLVINISNQAGLDDVESPSGKNIERNINESCEKSERSKEEITLIAVSKTKPIEKIKELYDLDIQDFGENKVQELKQKYNLLPKDIRWHMIGHLQTNKVKDIIDKVCLIHSVDSIHLAEVIEKEATKKDIIVDILLEINIAEEESKSGFKIDEVNSAIELISKFTHIRIKGLMTVAPYTINPEENRKFFSKLRELSIEIKDKNIYNVSMDILSMGMTNDYKVAIEEGATMVRIGTGIFGERSYK